MASQLNRRALSRSYKFAVKLAKNLRLAPPPHLGLPQLPLCAAAVVQAQQMAAALSGVTRGRLIPQQHPVPRGGEDEQEVNYSGGGGASRAFQGGAGTAGLT